MTYAWIVAGAVIGAPLRYFVGTRFDVAAGQFPWWTFTINVTGCFAIGLLLGLTEERGWFNREARLLLVTGLLGSYTTFSAFGWETYDLLRNDDLLRAALYAGGSVVLGVLATFAGVAIARLT
ncbi:MAG: fluoride efflux transporter CrcB [Dehalococcoidia bacterium]